jgi:alpha-galactosidase
MTVVVLRGGGAALVVDAGGPGVPRVVHWGADVADERQHIQRWTQLLLPGELIGAHVGPPRSHTTGRTQSLSFRRPPRCSATSASSGTSPRRPGTSGRSCARRSRSTSGCARCCTPGAVVRADHPDPAALVHGVVGEREALFAYVQLTTPALELPGPVRLPGLDADRAYRVAPLTLAGGPAIGSAQPPPWLAAGEITLTGRALAAAGLQLPALAPEQALLLHLTAAE